MLWGVFNEAALLGLLRSLPFVAAVALLLRRPAFGSFRYKFSLFLFAVAMAEALLLVEGGDRLYHADLLPWGPFICFWVLWLESVGIFLKQALAKPKSASTALCGVALGCAHHQRRVLSGAADAGSLLPTSRLRLTISAFKIKHFTGGLCEGKPPVFSFATCRTQPNAV